MSSDGSKRGFELDPFQREAMDAIDAGRSVLVAAPTGSGKTVVAEHAIEMALAEGARAFYTSPIKALANQKFRNFQKRYGTGDVGLLTGDNSINGGASIVVMTTEVLRNMLYEESKDLDTLRWVILDEVHYLQDRFRGPVWEEVILHLDASVGLVALSATVSNLDEVQDWFTAVRGPTDLVITTHRPVPLYEKLGFTRGKNRPIDLLPLFVQQRPNPEGERLDLSKSQRYGRNRKKEGGARTPRRSEVAQMLHDSGLAPSIYFVFSRAGCDDAVRQCSDAGLLFTDTEEARRIREILDAHLSRISPSDIKSLQLDAWISALERGVTSHHAGLVPACKEAVEQCFIEGLITIVFATETLALGVNMPARSVVLENLSKFNGETHELLTPLEYTQLTGRAGRRGIDDEGHAISLWSPHLAFADLTAVAGSTKFPLKSAFKPNYNMAANLIRRLDRDAAHEVIGRSFAQFQVDRSAVLWRSDVAKLRRKIAEASQDIHCDFGDVREYRDWLKHESLPRPANQDLSDAVADVLRDLRPGDVIESPDLGHAVVLSSTERSNGPRLQVVHPVGTSSYLRAEDFSEPPTSPAWIELPQPFRPKSPDFHKQVSVQLAELGLTSTINGHPVGTCPDAAAHLQALTSVDKLETKARRAVARMERQGGQLVAELDKIVSLLERLGYVDKWRLTPTGELLASIYHEGDLLLAEAIEAGTFARLDPAEFAAVASCITYDPRSSNEPPGGKLRTKSAESAAVALDTLAKRLRRNESDTLGAPKSPQIERGFATAAYKWAKGSPLGEIIEDAGGAGEFVRNVKQLVDLLRQISELPIDERIADTAADAAEQLDRGVVRSASVASGPVMVSEPPVAQADPVAD